MIEWFSQWNPVLTFLLAVGTFVLLVFNFFWIRKVREEDQGHKLETEMTNLVNKLDEKIVSLGREVSEIQGRLGIHKRHDP